MKTQNNYFQLGMVALLLGFMASCQETKVSPERSNAPCDGVSATVNGTNWCSNASYLIAYGGEPPLLQLIFKNQEAIMGIRVRYTGVGEYDLADTESDYCRIGDQMDYTVVSGKLTITQSPSSSKNEVSGLFHLELRNGDGEKVEIKNGRFNFVKGLGW
jgi:hypothetical protein